MGHAMVKFSPQLRTNVSLFESVIQARMLYDKCIKINCGLFPILIAFLILYIRVVKLNTPFAHPNFAACCQPKCYYVI